MNLGLSSARANTKDSSRKVSLEFRDIKKQFPGTLALNGVSFKVFPGEVLALLGENGAGKSTLMKILSGVWPAGTYSGDLSVATKDGDLSVAQFRSTRDALRAGIVMIHQELSIFPELTVGEHLELNNLPIWIKWDALHKRVQSFLDRLKINLRSKDRVGDLSVGGKQLVEIARALYGNARIIVFDEPTSALTSEEVTKLYEIVEHLRKEGKAILYITHRLDEVFRLADRAIILRDGQKVSEIHLLNQQNLVRLSRKETEPKIISWMVGRQISDIYPSKQHPVSPVSKDSSSSELLRVENFTLRSPLRKTLLKNVQFTLNKGEIIGLAGLLGAGRSETLEALFGVLAASGPRARGYTYSGGVWIKKKRWNLNTPKSAIEHRMALVTEDRKGSGLVLNQSIMKNMTLPVLASGRRDYFKSGPLKVFNWIKTETEKTSTERKMTEFRIKAVNSGQTVGELSGGNQQKVVLSKWLLTEPEILFLDEPTRGIDVGAKVEIYHWIQKLASSGIGVVLASSEMPELLGICHRILVLREGQIAADLNGDHATQEDIMRAAAL